MKRCWIAAGIVGLVIVGLGFASNALGQEQQADKPEREIVVAFEYPGMVLEVDDTVSLDLIIKNNGKKDEVVLLQIVKQPKDWRVQVKKYEDVVTGVFVASGQEKTLTLRAEDPNDADEVLPVGEYEFVVKATSEDGKLSSTATAHVKVAEDTEASGEGQEKEKKAVRITTSYPALRGPSDSTFEFSIDIHNETDKEEMFSLRADKPKGWDVSFKPSYESKYIGSLRIKGNLSQSVDVEVTPAPRAEVGEYTIKVYAECSKGQAETELKVTLTGKHKISCKTLNGVLSLTARKGEKANISMYVLNEGSATEKEITFTSFKPENWEVKFDPERIEGLEPGDMKQVEVTITPATEALVGDYSVAVSASSEEANDDIEFRVTVKAASTWGWIGVAIIVIVVVGLGVTFKRLGRR